MLHETNFQDKSAGFRYANTKGISDSTLLAIATAYKTGVSRKYKTLPARLLTQTFQNAVNVHVSVKYDGEGIFLYYEEGKDVIAFNAPSGRCRIGLPCLKAIQAQLVAKGVKRILAAGEIYVKSTKGRCRSGDVIHATVNGTKEERDNLAIAVYDLIMLDGKDRRADQKNYGENSKALTELFGNDTNGLFHQVDGETIPGKDVPAYFEKVTGILGQEGIVVRYPKAEGIFKIKPSITVDCTVIGYVEDEFEGQYGVMSLLCGLCAPDGKTIQTFARVGSGFTDDLRQTLLTELQALKTDAPLRMSDSDGRPIIFVKPKMVVEIEGEALVESNLEGQITSTQTLQWDGTKYSFQGINPCPRLSHATLHCIREDKVWDDGGTRMEQVIDDSAIKAILTPSRPEDDKPSIILREVFVKKDKESQAVRKILVIERNSIDFHRFTLHWTDFSPGRKDVFQNEIACADTQERLDALLAIYHVETSKRGWEKYKEIEAETA